MLNGKFEFYSFCEGRIIKTEDKYQYQYQLNDHLGNTVVLFEDKSGDNTVTNDEVIQRYYYYPFGAETKNAPWTQQPTPNIRYQYNGKEKIDELGLGWNDYGARNYDALLGRWMGVDALAEKYMGYSGYNYVLGNPIGLIDPDGMQVETCPTCPNTPDYDEARNSKSVFTYHKEEGILTNGDAEVEVKGSRTSEKFETKIETNPGKEILASATLVLSYDLNIPEGTDIVPQKWIGYAAVFVVGAVTYVGYELTMAKDKDDHMKGGRKSGRDRDYGIKDKEFWKAWEKHKSKLPGKGRLKDIKDKEEADDLYENWKNTKDF